MNLKTVAAVGTAFGILGVGSAFATFARIESMGKNTTYIMDDVSIFDNPANINLYSNYLIGEFGPYTNNDMKAGGNVDPQHPNFGGIFAISLGDVNNPDPRISIGGLFGRINTDLVQYLPDAVIGDNGKSVDVPETVTNFDGFLAVRFRTATHGACISMLLSRTVATRMKKATTRSRRTLTLLSWKWAVV